jgi:hypothetical protein
MDAAPLPARGVAFEFPCTGIGGGIHLPLASNFTSQVTEFWKTKKYSFSPLKSGHFQSNRAQVGKF